MWSVAATISGVLLTALIALGVYLVKGQHRTDTTLAVLEAEHQNNGGSSLRDAVDRIEAKVDENGRQLQTHLVEAAKQEALFQAHLQTHGTTVVVHPAPAPPGENL